jgi:predicted RNA-binding Zn-ribbon protein involved in translation (DUF1610 family)
MGFLRIMVTVGAVYGPNTATREPFFTRNRPEGAPVARMVRQTVEDSFVIDARELARTGRLTPGYHGTLTGPQGEGREVTLTFHVDEQFLYIDSLQAIHPTADHHFPIELTITVTSFGAKRVSFACPRCGWIKDTLFLPYGADDLGCRNCHSLSYASRQRRGASPKDTLLSPAAPEASEPDRDRFYWGSQERAEEWWARQETREVGTETPAVPRPPGRPKEKRTYERHLPFTTDERRSESEGFCLRCRAYREPLGPRKVTLPNGRRAIRGTCPECGAGIMLIIKKG